jgi:hypothetical protein
VIPPALIGAIMIVALLALVPTRRLYLAGWGTGLLAAYFLSLILLAAIVVEVRGPARWLLPVLIVAYLLPFMTPRRGLARLFGLAQPEPEPRSEPRNVGPEVIDPPAATPPQSRARRFRARIRRE